MGTIIGQAIMKYRLRCIAGILWSWWRVKTSALPWSTAIGILRSRSRSLACKRVYMQIRLPAINQTRPGRTRGHAAFYLPVAPRYASRSNETNATCTDVSLAETTSPRFNSFNPRPRNNQRSFHRHPHGYPSVRVRKCSVECIILISLVI